MLGFIKRIFLFSPKQFIYCILLMILLGLTEGFSIASILPILSLSGVGRNVSSSLNISFLNFSHYRLTLWQSLVIFIVLVSLTAVLQKINTNSLAKFQQKFSTHLTKTLYQKLANTTWNYWILKTKSDVSHVINNEVARVSFGCHFLFQALANTIILVIYVGLSIFVAPEMTLLIIVGGCLLFLLFSSLIRKSRKAGQEISKISRNVFFHLNEMLDGMKEIKLYGLEQSQIHRLEKYRVEIENSYLKFNDLQSSLDMFYKISSAIFISFIFFIAITIMKLNVEYLIFILVIFARIWPKINIIQNALHSLIISLPAFQSVLSLEQEADKNHNLKSLQKHEIIEFHRLNFKNVSFSYSCDDKLKLHQINFEINQGDFIGCIGESGSGKSTLADILLGLLQPTDGSVLVNGHQLKNVQQDWQRLVSYVPQDVYVFNASVRDNLTLSLANHIDDKEIWDILKIVQLFNLVDRLPDKLNSILGDRGVSLSGGERQRIVLARALLRKPQVLILDEATSALDNNNEQLIQNALEQIKGKLTLFVIAHRTATLKNANKVIHLKKGRIIDGY